MSSCSSRAQEILKRLIEYFNRGILLDVVVFVVNLILMTILSRQLANLFQQANTQEAEPI
ncbi:MAG: hypothetical protein ABJC10_11510 [Acidobacteriota bacterium]